MGLRQRDLDWSGRELLDIYCCARAKVTAIDKWLETHPLIDESGNVVNAMRFYVAALNTSVRTLEALRSVLADMAREDARFDKALSALALEGSRTRKPVDE
jgi:hypothetical protein